MKESDFEAKGQSNEAGEKSSIESSESIEKVASADAEQALYERISKQRGDFEEMRESLEKLNQERMDLEAEHEENEEKASKMFAQFVATNAEAMKGMEGNTLGLSPEKLIIENGFAAESLKINGGADGEQPFSREKILADVINDYIRTEDPALIEGIEFDKEVATLVKAGNLDLAEKMLHKLPEGSFNGETAKLLADSGEEIILASNLAAFENGSLDIDTVQALLDADTAKALIKHHEKIGEINAYQFEELVNKIPLEERYGFLDKHDAGPEYRDAHMNAAVLNELSENGIENMQYILRQEGMKLSNDVAYGMYEVATSDAERAEVADLILDNMDKFPGLEAEWIEKITTAEGKTERILNGDKAGEFKERVLEQDNKKAGQGKQGNSPQGNIILMQESNLEAAVKLAVKAAKAALKLAWKVAKAVAKAAWAGVKAGVATVRVFLGI